MVVQRVIAAIGLLIVTGCRPFVGSCSWFEPSGASVQVTAQRDPVSGECNCIGCSAPGKFQIIRSAYVLEFSNGDRWYPQLLLRARRAGGAPLSLRGHRLLQFDKTSRWQSEQPYDYFLEYALIGGQAPPPKDLHPTLWTVDVIDRDGKVIGSETMTLTLKTRRDFDVEVGI